MTEQEIMSEIKDANLNYLMLAQQMIRADKATAVFRLGLNKGVADLLEGLSNFQILKLSSSNMMLARFRFEDGALLNMLTDYTKDRELANSHSAILMSSEVV